MELMSTVVIVVGLVAIILWLGIVALATPAVVYRFGHRLAVGSRQFEEALSSALGAKLHGGNRITRLDNGSQFYPEMLGAIAAARRFANIHSPATRSRASPTRVFTMVSLASLTKRQMLGGAWCAPPDSSAAPASTPASAEWRHARAVA